MTEEDIITTVKSKEQKLLERDEKRKKISKGYYDLEEAEIQRIVAAAQKGSVKDQHRLMEIFSNFLEKYVNILYNQFFDLRDYDTKQFVLLYVPGKSPLGQKIKTNQLNLTSYKEVSKVFGRIITMIKRYNNKDDVRQTVNAAFIECIKIYKPKPSKQGGQVPFSGYIYRYYKFKLKKYVDEFLIDQNGLNNYPLITDDEVSSSFNMEDGATGVYETAVLRATPLERLLVIEDIDENWVEGDGAQYPFSELKKFERQLLKWRYIDGLRPNKIAEKTSDHPNTCRQHIKTITAKVEALLEAEAPLDWWN